MQFGPVENQLLSTTRQVASYDGQGFDGDDSFELCILNMKMGWTMIIEKHFDDHPVKRAYCGQVNTSVS
jgi:hypothetical protein